MKWKIPPRIKVYEALGAIADGRVRVRGNSAIVQSSRRDKEYTVRYDPEKNATTSNDNGSYWQGYLGYPAIAFLMKKGVIGYDKAVARMLKGIAWKDINTKFKNDFDKTERYVCEQIKEKEADIHRLDEEIKSVMAQLKKLKLGKLSTLNTLPPQT